MRTSGRAARHRSASGSASGCTSSTQGSAAGKAATNGTMRAIAGRVARQTTPKPRVGCHRSGSRSTASSAGRPVNGKPVGATWGPCWSGPEEADAVPARAQGQRQRQIRKQVAGGADGDHDDVARYLLFDFFPR